MIIGHRPMDGDRKKYKKFCILPRKCSDGTIRWLERVEVAEQYTWYGSFGSWRVIRIEPIED